MATIGDYIKEELEAVRIPLGTAQLASLYLKNGVVSTEEITTENMETMEKALLSVIPKLLLMPDKTTGDTSLKWDRSAVLNYYKLKCDEYGIVDNLNEESTITDISNIW